jgi:DNA-binding MarR family transcriptional regulator
MSHQVHNPSVGEKPTPSDLAKMSRASVAPFTAASVGRLSHLFPHWLLLNVETPLGIPASRLLVLWILRNEKALTMGEIAQMIDLTPRGVTRIVDGLEADGFATRTEDESDKRIKVVELTTKGRRFLDASLPKVHQKYVELFAVLDKSEAVELVRLLEKLTDHMKMQIDAE